MNYWHDIKPGEKIPESVNVIVEIPTGSQNKYEYDKKNGLIKLDRVLYSPFHYPTEYGIVPQTLAEDGDPLDALVLVTAATAPGILIECRPIGIMKMLDKGEADNKVLFVPIEDPRFKNFKDLKDVEEHTLKEIAHFFESYKHLEGKKVEVQGWENAEEAKKEIIKSIEAYKKEFKKK